jgi:hypothetical protein
MNAIVVLPQQRFECMPIAACGAVDEIAIGVEWFAGACRQTKQFRGTCARPELDRRTFWSLQGMILSIKPRGFRRHRNLLPRGGIAAFIHETYVRQESLGGAKFFFEGLPSTYVCNSG